MAWRLTPADSDTSALEGFVSKTKDKTEYIRGTALLLRAKGRKADEVTDELGVCRGAVFKWERLYAKLGIEGLLGIKVRRKKGTHPGALRRTKVVVAGRNFLEDVTRLCGSWREILR
jgi:hypothetical protein